jgi:ACT domain-containing protein
LVSAGLSKSAVYRAASDIERFAERLVDKRGRKPTVKEIAEAAKKVDLSRIGESVLQ